MAKIKSDMEKWVGLRKDVAKPTLYQWRIAFDKVAVNKCYNLLECLISLSSGINAQENVLRAEQVGKF